MGDFLDKLMEILVVVQIIATILLVIVLVAVLVDQLFAAQETTTAVVIGRDEGVRHLLIGKILTPFHYWKLSFQIDGEVYFSDVSESCYSKTNIGDWIGIRIRRGFFTTDVYPDCH